MVGQACSEYSRKLLLDGIKRIAAGEAQTAGLPADRLPVVTVDPNPGLATWNTPDFSERMATFFKGRFGAGRVVAIDRLSVVFVIVLAALFLGESLGWKSVAGAILMVAGALLITLN